jgi:hypothetical protein
MLGENSNLKNRICSKREKKEISSSFYSFSYFFHIHCNSSLFSFSVYFNCILRVVVRYVNSTLGRKIREKIRKLELGKFNESGVNIVQSYFFKNSGLMKK